jgi:hypothetical protein
MSEVGIEREAAQQPNLFKDSKPTAAKDHNREIEPS